MNIQLSEFVRQQGLQPGRIVLALSGGLDSMILLHLLHTQRQQLPVIEAVHINHQLQKASAEWADFCQQQCRHLNIPLTVLEVIVAVSGEGIEAAARQARYQALAGFMQADDLLLTAHHADDQVETLLLQLFRGAGIDGTAAMPTLKPFARGHHGRPLLETTRAQLEAYATEQGLIWVEDPSNRDTEFDRNFLRHELLPLLQQRWPGVGRNLVRVAQNHAESQQLLNDYLQTQLRDCVDDEGRLAVESLQTRALEEQRQLLRAWIREQGHRAPSRKVLERMQVELFTPREDAQPQVAWGQSIVRRFHGQLYLDARPLAFDTSQVINWHTMESLSIAGAGRLQMIEVAGGGLPAEWQHRQWQVRFRQGGERLQRAGADHHQSLKKRLQQAAIPPWQRQCLPLLYCDNELVFIPGVFQKQRTGPEETGIMPHWEWESAISD